MKPEQELEQRIKGYRRHRAERARLGYIAFFVVGALMVVGVSIIDSRTPHPPPEGTFDLVRPGFVFGCMILMGIMFVLAVRQTTIFAADISRELAKLPTRKVVSLTERIAGEGRSFVIHELCLRAKHHGDRLARAFYLRQPTASFVGLNSRPPAPSTPNPWLRIFALLWIALTASTMIATIIAFVGYIRVINGQATYDYVSTAGYLARDLILGWAVLGAISMIGLFLQSDKVPTLTDRTPEECLAAILDAPDQIRGRLLMRLSIRATHEAEFKEAARHLGLIPEAERALHLKEILHPDEIESS